MFGEQTTRLRRTQVGADPANRPVYDWVPLVLPAGAAFDPGGSVEPAEVGRAQVVTTPKAYFEQPVDVTAGDRLQVRGNTYDVVGDPAVWVDPWGSDLGGVVVELQRSTEEG